MIHFKSLTFLFLTLNNDYLIQIFIITLIHITLIILSLIILINLSVLYFLFIHVLMLFIIIFNQIPLINHFSHRFMDFI